MDKFKNGDKVRQIGKSQLMTVDDSCWTSGAWNGIHCAGPHRDARWETSVHLVERKGEDYAKVIS